MTPRWYDSAPEILAFLMSLTRASKAGAIDLQITVEMIQDLCEKPWKWDDEYYYWVASDRPALYEAPPVDLDEVG